MVPLGSRPPCQQSSRLMNWYPAAFIPLVAIAAAVLLISASLMLQPKLFQLFQPIGGVSARLFVTAWTTGTGKNSTPIRTEEGKMRRMSISGAFGTGRFEGP